ncbi:hypothetical protein BH10PLA2_BH10PLA2_18600 [soil metagenome]
MIAMAHQIWHSTTDLFRPGRRIRQQARRHTTPRLTGPLKIREAEAWLDWFENHSIRPRLTLLANGYFEMDWDTEETAAPLKA